MKVELTAIQNNPYNVREDYGDLSGLVTSLRKYGVVQPLIVRKKGNEKYELVFGHRRLEAMRDMGVDEVEIDVREINNPDMATLALCENVHRKDLTPVELARAYRKGLDATKLSINQFSGLIGITGSVIRDYLFILDLPKGVLSNSGKYNATQLISLGKLNGLSRDVRIMLENALEEKAIASQFLRQVVSACEKIFASPLPYRSKRNLCQEMILHDYSTLPPEDYKDIAILADSLLNQKLAQYNENLRKTEKARRGKKDKPIRKIGDVIHIDRRLDDVTFRLRECTSSVTKAIREGYYVRASKKSRKKFKTCVSHLVSGIEEILENDKTPE